VYVRSLSVYGKYLLEKESEVAKYRPLKIYPYEYCIYLKHSYTYAVLIIFYSRDATLLR